MGHGVPDIKQESKVKMDEQEKLEVLAEIFDWDVGELLPEKQLDELSWDSMAMLSVIAMAKARFNRKVPGAQIRAFKTVKDVLDIMQAE